MAHRVAGQNEGLLPQAGDGLPAQRILYRNTQFSFCFVLPAAWKGYRILGENWEGAPISKEASTDDSGASMNFGTKIVIRHPRWTEDTPYEDIPILIFTHREWKQVHKEKLSLGAAPIGPEELARNRQYIFALPARYNFDYSEGWEEVDKLLRNHALEAPCKSEAARAK